MATSYRFDVYDTSGVKQFILMDFLGFAYTRSVNAPGILSFGISGEHALLSSIADKWQVEVWRRPEGEDWARENSFLYRDIDWKYKDKALGILICDGIMSMLNWRIVNWSAGTNNRSAFTSDKAETIMKTLVDYNAASNATTGNGRKRNGAITGLTVESDGANGDTRNWYCHGKNLLKTLQDFAFIAGGDFDLVKTSPTAWQFRWYTGQLGTDRSASVTFGMNYGNMGKPSYSEMRSDEKTVACVWGQGEGSERDYVTRTGVNYISTTNDFELYVDAREIDLGDTSGLNSKGDQKMIVREATKEFLFEAIQTKSTIYGVDYFLGDKVKAINPFDDSSLTLKVNKVSVSMDEEGEETVMPEFTTLL